MNSENATPLEMYITIGERLFLESSKMIAVEVRQRLEREITSRMLLSRVVYTHLVKYNHTMRANEIVVIVSRLIDGLFSLISENITKTIRRTISSTPVQ